MKQYFLIVCCLFLWLSDSAQDNATFILKGKIKGKPHGKIFINYFNGNSVYYRDTAEIQRGQFHFKGYINEPVRATLFIPDESAGKNRLNELEFYIEPGEITIQVTLNAYNNAIIEGSLSQKEWQQYLSTYDSIELKWKTLLDSLILAKESGNDLLVEKLWEERMPFYQKEVDDNVFFFLRSNRNSFISPDLLTPYLHRLPLDTIKSFYTFFTERVQVSRKGKFIYDFILKEEKVAIGTVIPNLSFMDMNGKSYELLSLRGRYVLLDFWASWCVPCRKETPYHLEVYRSIEIEVLKLYLFQST